MVIFTEVEKRILIHYGLQGQIIKTIIVSKWFVRFCSNLMCYIIGHIPTYFLGSSGFIVLLRRTRKNSKALIVYGVNVLKGCSD